MLSVQMRPGAVFSTESSIYCEMICPQGKMIMQDKLEKERNDAKNYVEEYVYEMRDKLHGTFEKFVNESVRAVTWIEI